ncbi:MAG TPA: DUF2723 domain-containing protein [Gemmatimonadales bacterium]|nr:DUF2723 domain-containing protein [Gemmatimonadales bacterium]
MNPESSRPPYVWAAATGALVLVIYLLTLAPTTAFWDTSEYIAAAKVLGIPHPPGNPLFTLMAHVWGLLPLSSSYAVRINIFAAVTSAACAALWFLVAERWLRTLVPLRMPRIGAAAAGSLVGALSWTVWNQSTVNEKVYTVSMLSIALVAWIIVRWADQPAGARHDRHLVLVAYLLALTSTNHLMGILALPLVAVYVLWTEPKALLRPTVVFGSIVALLVGISINYIYLPIRAGQYPPINEGEPIGFFSTALQEVLGRAQYGKPSVFDRQTASFFDQLANYWQYWRWQFARDWTGFAPLATGIFTALGLTGLWALIRKDRRAGLAALALFGTLTVALIYYLNFKYGFSIFPERSLNREVRERDYFFIASFSFFGVLVAIGFGALMRSIVEALRDRGTEAGRWAAASGVLALAVVPLFGNRLTASRAGETLAHDFAVDILQSVEPYGILITAGDNDTFPLWFAQEVEGVRRDVTLANLSLMNTRWHLKQIQRRDTPEFQPGIAAELWRPRPAEGGQPLTDSVARRESLIRWPRPDNPVIALTQEQIADTLLLPDIGAAPAALPPFGNVQIEFANQYLMLQDLMTAVLIRDNIGHRPIYFAWSTGPYADQTLGLAPYLISQGLVRKLNNGPVVVNDSIVVSQILGYVDLPRSSALMWNEYDWESAAKPRPFGWVDPPSSSILQLYAIVYGGMADLYRSRGLTELAVRSDSISAAVRANIVGPQP